MASQNIYLNRLNKRGIANKYFLKVTTSITGTLSVHKVSTRYRGNEKALNYSERKQEQTKAKRHLITAGR